MRVEKPHEDNPFSPVENSNIENDYISEMDKRSKEAATLREVNNFSFIFNGRVLIILDLFWLFKFHQSAS